MNSGDHYVNVIASYCISMSLGGLNFLLIIYVVNIYKLRR